MHSIIYVQASECLCVLCLFAARRLCAYQRAHLLSRTGFTTAREAAQAAGSGGGTQAYWLWCVSIHTHTHTHTCPTVKMYIVTMPARAYPYVCAHVVSHQDANADHTLRNAEYTPALCAVQIGILCTCDFVHHCVTGSGGDAITDACVALCLHGRARW